MESISTYNRHINLPNLVWFHPFVFTGKEKDSLRLNPQSGGLCGARLTSPPDLFTRFYYFGARYYDPSLSGLFLSVDPMADKYPSISPYAYCAWNPIKIIDPLGDTIKNAYEQFKDIRKDIEYYEKLIDNTNNQDVVSGYLKEIDLIKEKNRKYNIVKDLIEKFKMTN